MKNLQLTTVLLFMSLFFAHADVRLPAIFGNNMVFQQNTQVNLWGKATANKTITIKASWGKDIIKTTSDASGNWKTTLKTPKADGRLHTLTLSDGVSLTLSNILLGELWICSGQSNMEMPMKGFKGQPVENSNMEILKSTNPNLRLFVVQRKSTIDAQPDVSGQWQQANPESVKEFSATGYYFGRLLQQTLQVPVGLIQTAWGGSCIEAWMSEDMLRAFPSVKIPKAEADIKEKNRTPTTLYQAMIHPIVGFTIKGFIWYQGETNYDRAGSYTEMFTTMVAGWRKKWGQDVTIPFYYCQIAPYDYSLITKSGEEVINSAYLREAQLNAESQLPISGMAVLLDAGLKSGIHPRNKQTPGERLALLALTKTYGLQGVASESPIVKNVEIHADTVVVNFDRAPMWLVARNSELKLFTIAGDDKVFHPAKAWIDRSKVLVRSEEVKNPVAVRYAFDNYVEGDLFSTEGLPVSSFRTDNW